MNQQQQQIDINRLIPAAAPQTDPMQALMQLMQMSQGQQRLDQQGQTTDANVDYLRAQANHLQSLMQTAQDEMELKRQQQALSAQISGRELDLRGRDIESREGIAANQLEAQQGMAEQRNATTAFMQLLDPISMLERPRSFNAEGQAALQSLFQQTGLPPGLAALLMGNPDAIGMPQFNNVDGMYDTMDVLNALSRH